MLPVWSSALALPLFVALALARPLALSLVLLLGFARNSQAEDLVPRLRAAAEAVPTVTVPFVQVKNLAMLEAPLEAHGTLLIDRPRRRLELLFTGRSQLVLERGHLQRRDAAGREEALGPEAPAIAAQLQGLLDGNFSALAELFVITQPAEVGPTLQLVPRTAELQRFIERLEITFRADLAAPARLTLVATGGDATTYTFGLHAP